MPSAASGISRRMPSPRPRPGFEFEDRLDRTGAGAGDLARGGAVGIDGEAGGCRPAARHSAALAKWRPAVDGLQRPAQRQHVAPIAVGVKQGFQERRRRARPARFELRQPVSAAIEISLVFRACAFLSTGRLCGVSLILDPIPIRDRRKAVERCRPFAKATGCAPVAAECGRSACRDRPVARRQARGPRSRSSHLVQLRGKPRPRSAKPRVDAAGPPLFGALADLVRREEPAAWRRARPARRATKPGG